MRVEVNNYSFDYTDDGEGQPVVFVHGGISDRRTWDHQRGALGNGLRTIAISRRYYWPNEPIPEDADYSMVEHADDLTAIIEELDLAPAHLVGNSYGAYICLLCAIRRPEVIRSLVLAEPPVIPLFLSDPPKVSELLRLVLRRPAATWALLKVGVRGINPIRADMRRGDGEAVLRRFLPLVLGRRFAENLSEERMEQARVNLIPALWLGSGFAPLSDDEVRRVRLPTLVTVGELTPAWLGRHLPKRLTELLPNAELARIPGASHLMHEDNPDYFNATVSTFLKSMSERTSS